MEDSIVFTAAAVVATSYSSALGSARGGPGQQRPSLKGGRNRSTEEGWEGVGKPSSKGPPSNCWMGENRGNTGGGVVEVLRFEPHDPADGSFWGARQGGRMRKG